MAQPSNKGLPASPRDPDLARIDELVRDLGEGDGTPNAMIREHLEAARFYLLGSMPAEYQLNLELAEGLVSDLDDENLQGRIREFLRSQRSTPA